MCDLAAAVGAGGEDGLVHDRELGNREPKHLAAASTMQHRVACSDEARQLIATQRVDVHDVRSSMPAGRMDTVVNGLSNTTPTRQEQGQT
jgi:hypothetical protein